MIPVTISSRFRSGAGDMAFRASKKSSGVIAGRLLGQEGLGFVRSRHHGGPLGKGGFCGF